MGNTKTSLKAFTLCATNNASAEVTVPTDHKHTPDTRESDVQGHVLGKQKALAVLEHLLSENRAFASAEEPTVPPSTPALRIKLARDGQTPGAVVVTCSDSRVPPEVLFRAQVGDMFVVRTAGNVADDISTIASVEFALVKLDVTLLLVLGHEQCDAVEAGLMYKEHPSSTQGQHTPALLEHITNIAHRIDLTDAQYQDREHMASAAVASHTIQVAESLRTQSDTVREFEEAGKLLIVPAVYDIATGFVNVLGG